MSELQRRSRETEPLYDCCRIGIAYRDRQVLYDRINRRVDRMLEAGLLDEARAFFREGKQTAAQAIGYKELKPFLDGECGLEEAVESLKQATRRYAKRAAHLVPPGSPDPLGLPRRNGRSGCGAAGKRRKLPEIS